MVAMKVKHLAHLALAGLLIWGTGATGAENQKQGKPAQVRSSGGAKVNAGGGARFHAQSQGGARINRGNAVRVQNQNRITVRQQHFKRNVTVDRNVTRHRAVVKQQNFQQQQSVQSTERNRIRSGDKKLASKQAVVQISESQRLRIREAFRDHRRRFHRVAHVGFPIFVGAYVPRDYAIYDMPSYFYDDVPEYEGYKYIIVGDELLIIDPETWEIIAIIPV